MVEFADGGFDAVVSCLTFHEIGDVARKGASIEEFGVLADALPLVAGTKP